MESASRLCDLISESLLPYLEPKPARLSRENRKDVLLSLTRVHREIQQWVANSDIEPDEMGEDSYSNHHWQHSMQKMASGEHDCLCNSISTMVAFLSVDCQFARHAVGNIIFSTFIFLIKFEYLWAKSLQMIWLSLVAFMSTTFSCRELLVPAMNINENLILQELSIENFAQVHSLQFATFIAVLNSRLLNANLFVTVHLLQSLRNVLKSLKHESHNLVEVFMQSAASFLIKIPWDSFIEMLGKCYHTNMRSYIHVDQLDTRSSLTGMKNLFLGTVLQLCCSLVKVYGLEVDRTSSMKKHSVYINFCDLVPKLLSCCFIDHLGYNREFLSGYLGHKLLTMMTRLSLHSFWKISHPETWLKYLGQYFGEILHQSISGCAELDNCIVASPFLSSNVNVDKFYVRHLQRQAIFLLFKCSFTIAGVDANKNSTCKEKITSFSRGPQLCTIHCDLGSSEAFSWLQRWCPVDKVQDCNYSKSYNNFATSFLQLYMEEDDLLFNMLLLLIEAPFSSWQKDCINQNGFVGANKDQICHFSIIFCPIRLFHIVLLLLHYDHLVLIDYLISKDTGIHCLQYLLRCLHVIQSSWPAFKQFSMFGKKSNCYNTKRKKIRKDDTEDPTIFPSTSTAFGGQLTGRNKYGQVAYEISDSETFGKAKGCLNSLKRSLGELQRKSLFPYNPMPLIKSLTKFQELCMESNFQQT